MMSEEGDLGKQRVLTTVNESWTGGKNFLGRGGAFRRKVLHAERRRFFSVCICVLCT